MSVKTVLYVVKREMVILNLQRYEIRWFFCQGYLEEGHSAEVRGHGQGKIGDNVNGAEQRGNVITRK